MYTLIDSPIGRLLLTGSDDALQGLYMQEGRLPAIVPGEGRDDGAFRETSRQLDEYWAGDRTSFDLPLDPHGTDFQRRVWAGLLTIPYGETRSYGQLAAQLGNPTASRAVGLANGRNPIAVIVPCHRVIGADGSLTGFGGGIERKRTLLELEGSLPQPALFG